MQTWEPRFWAKVDKSGDCWLWTDALSEKGYGTFSVGRSSRKRAHVWSYELEHGPLPSGSRLDHRCHVKHCVRPKHLRPVTNKQNLENRKGAQSNSKSGIRGVCWDKRYGKWLATVKHNGKQVYREHFESVEGASVAVVEARLIHFTHNEVDRRKQPA